tara:strand:- start:4953 stop:5207 length:255 start_codon:yes stop_codon:yes gene_type:complete
MRYKILNKQHKTYHDLFSKIQEQAMAAPIPTPADLTTHAELPTPADLTTHAELPTPTPIPENENVEYIYEEVEVDEDIDEENET